MSKCWKCNKEFYSEDLIRTLCDECLEKIPKTTATTDFVNLLNSEIKDLVDDFDSKDQRIAELEEQLKNAIVPKFKIGQEVWCVYEYWWNGKFADEPNKFAINNFIIDAINIDKYGQYYIFHKEYEGRDNIICYQPNFNGNRFNVMSGVQNHYIDAYYLFTTKEEAEAKLEELKGEKK